MLKRNSILLLSLALILFVSCSAGGDAVSPDDATRDNTRLNPGQTLCLGLWQFRADRTTGDVNLTQLRTADKIINVLSFMEPPVFTQMDLDWDDLFIDFDNGKIDVGVIFRHPIPDDVYTGFDVRGVVFGPKLTNADGLTIIPSPEFFSGVPFGYQDGLLGVPDDIANYSGLAGYKYYAAGIGEDEDVVTFFANPDNLAERGKFPSATSIQRNYNLDWNGTGYDFLVFNYSIYANYDWPVGDMPWTLDDWNISSANGAEAFCINTTETANSLYYSDGSGGGSISLQAEIWDWQDDISNVDLTFDWASGPTPSDAAFSIVGPGSDVHSTIWEVSGASHNPTAWGPMDILITVTDSKTFGEHWFLDLLPTGHSMYDHKIYTCFIHSTNVSDQILVWNPVVEVDADYGTKARATDDLTIPNYKSTYDSETLFNVIGINAVSTDLVTYEYYISTSNTTQTGSPAGWVAFTFDDGGDFLVSWEDYVSIAPATVYAWVRADDGTATSNPVMCPTAIDLSKVVLQVNLINHVDWNVMTSNSGAYWMAYSFTTDSYLRYSNLTSLTGYGRAYWPTPKQLTAESNYSFEFYVKPYFVWASTWPGCYLSRRYSSSMDEDGTAIGENLYSTPSGSIFTEAFTPTASGSYYFGYYGNDACTSSAYNAFSVGFSDTGIYEDP